MDEATMNELREAGWMSPGDRATVLHGFDWLATQHHDHLHKEMIKHGQRTPQACDAQTCKFASQMIGWLRMTMKDERSEG